MHKEGQELTLEERLASIKNLKPEDQWQQALLLKDEWANSLTHAIGFILSLIGLCVLIQLPFQAKDQWRLINFLIYGLSLVLLYGASTFYHFVKNPQLKKLLRTLDHCAIYLLIAGSYTPFTLLVLGGTWGWFLFSIVWGLALLGIILKIFFKYRFSLLSTLLYLFMGWIIVIAIEPLTNQLHPEGLYWLLAGGISYTIGVIFYILDKRRFFHAIWHLFVLGGSICHYFAVLFYI